jgi:WD40 repeat protein
MTGPGDGIAGIALSPDGRTLAAGTDDSTENGAVWLWDVADTLHANPTGAALSDQVGTVNSVGFSPAGRALAADVGPGRLWDMTADAAIARICAAAGSSLSPQAWQLYVPELPATPLCR